MVNNIVTPATEPGKYKLLIYIFSLCYRLSTFVENPLNPPLFMQNKPNLPNSRMNTTSVTTTNYKENKLCRHRKNKPNQSQFIAPRSLNMQNKPLVSINLPTNVKYTLGLIAEHIVPIVPCFILVF